MLVSSPKLPNKRLSLSGFPLLFPDLYKVAPILFTLLPYHSLPPSLEDFKVAPILFLAPLPQPTPYLDNYTSPEDE